MFGNFVLHEFTKSLAAHSATQIMGSQVAFFFLPVRRIPPTKRNKAAKSNFSFVFAIPEMGLFYGIKNAVTSTVVKNTDQKRRRHLLMACDFLRTVCFGTVYSFFSSVVYPRFVKYIVRLFSVISA